MWHMLLALIPFAFSLTISPGPSNVIVMASTTNFGYRRSLPLILGIVSGLALMALAGGLGLSQLFERYPVARNLLKIVGMVYVLYLAWRIANSKGLKLRAENARTMTFFEGFVFQWLNVKGWLMVISVVATYTVTEYALFPQILLISIVFLVLAFLSVSVWGMFGTLIARFLQSPASLRIFNAALALTLVLSLLPLLTEFSH